MALWLNENLCSFNVNSQCFRTLKNTKFQTDFMTVTWIWVARGYSSITHLNGALKTGVGTKFLAVGIRNNGQTQQSGGLCL